MCPSCFIQLTSLAWIKGVAASCRLAVADENSKVDVGEEKRSKLVALRGRSPSDDRLGLHSSPLDPEGVW